MTSSIDFFLHQIWNHKISDSDSGWMVVSNYGCVSGLVIKNVGSDICLPRFESLHCHVLAMALRQPLNTCASVSSSDISES